MRKRIAAILLPLLTGTVAVGLQNSKAKAADSGTAQPKSGSVGPANRDPVADLWGKSDIWVMERTYHA
jgi:hypothetical protein